MQSLPSIYVVSDIHRDYGPFEWPDAARAADVIVVAGDLSNGVFDIEFLKQPGKPLVFVPGNHDFWNKDAQQDMFDMFEEMKRAAAGTQVHVLWDDEVVLNGVRFLGTPLWGSFGNYNEELVRASWTHSQDYRHIGAKRWYADPLNKVRHLAKFEDGEQGRELAERGAFTPFVAFSLYEKSINFIRKALGDPFAGPTVLVTHMAPSFDCLRKSESVPARLLEPANWHCRGFDNSGLARVGGYVGDLGDIFEMYRDELDLVIHGHIHQSLDIICGATRVVANPRGNYSGPLQKDDNRAFWGNFRVTDEMVADSAARFARYPYWGDNYDFEPEKIVRVENGLAPVIAAMIKEVLPQLSSLLEEVEGLAPHVGHGTPAIRRSVQESATARGRTFEATVEQLLNEVVSAVGSCSYRRQQLWQQCLEALGLPCEGARLWGDFNEEDDFGTPVSPADEIAKVILTMREILRLLPRVPGAPEAGREKCGQLLAEVLEEMNAANLAPILVSRAPTSHWRKLHINLGEVEADEVQEALDKREWALTPRLTAAYGLRNARITLRSRYPEDGLRAPSPCQGEW